MIVTLYANRFDPGNRCKDTYRGTSATIDFQNKNVR